jgi:hypothetical protein
VSVAQPLAGVAKANVLKRIQERSKLRFFFRSQVHLETLIVEV